jgi:hypothetical protein
MSEPAWWNLWARFFAPRSEWPQPTPLPCYSVSAPYDCSVCTTTGEVRGAYRQAQREGRDAFNVCEQHEGQLRFFYAEELGLGRNARLVSGPGKIYRKIGGAR